jgi:hypothetical protein
MCESIAIATVADGNKLPGTLKLISLARSRDCHTSGKTWRVVESANVQNCISLEAADIAG